MLLGIVSKLPLLSLAASVLRQCYAKVSAGPPLSTNHYGPQRPCSAKEGKRSAVFGKSSYGLVTNLAGVIMLHEAGLAVIVEQVNNVERCERQSRQKPPQTLIRLCPRPRGEMNGQAPSFDSPPCRTPATEPRGFSWRSNSPQHPSGGRA